MIKVWLGRSLGVLVLSIITLAGVTGVGSRPGVVVTADSQWGAAISVTSAE